jgi:hypothetical protein
MRKLSPSLISNTSAPSRDTICRRRKMSSPSSVCW